MILYYHPESDCVFAEQYQHIDWLHVEPNQCVEVSCDPEMVARYNRENPGYPVHLYADREDGLGYCMICRAGECELTTDCPGEPQVEIRRALVCAGTLDYWSGVWFNASA